MLWGAPHGQGTLIAASQGQVFASTSPRSDDIVVHEARTGRRLLSVSAPGAVSISLAPDGKRLA